MIRCFFFVALTLFICSYSNAEVISFDANDASAWEVFQDDDAEAVFGFDYSPFGIPAAPSGGDDTLGIYLAANIEEPAGAAGIAVSPRAFSATGRYTIVADLWMNFYADFANVGTTEFAGMFVGFDSVSDGTIFGAGLLADSDGDTARDFRLYNNGVEISIDSGLYNVASQDNADPELASQFAGGEVPELQTDLDFFDPANEAYIVDDGTMAFEWRTFEADVDTESGTATFSIDGLEIGTIDAEVEDSLKLDGRFSLALTDIFSSVSPVPDFTFALFDNVTVDIQRQGTTGDFDGDGDLDLDDLNNLVSKIRAQSDETRFDVNQDGDVDAVDLSAWVTDVKQTWMGDANLDGEFNSSDFVLVFQNGEYEDGVAMNSTWSEGDWNADGEFSSTDFVVAFQDGGFEQGPRAATLTVPEPTLSILGVAIVMLGVLRHRDRDWPSK